LDRNPYALLWETLRCSLGLWILFKQNDWFGASGYFEPVIYILASYFIISLLVTGWFVVKHKKEDKDQSAVGSLQSVKL
jgi:hypothetical protein